MTPPPDTASSSGPAAPPAPSASPVRELTLRAVVIGGLITLVFTAANVYLGLKVGLTFATSIPAAVISMAVLRKVRDHTIAENNIVQTIASAAGTLSAIIFVLPGLIMIGWWTGFPYWTTMLICLIGGILGVMYSIPLRRALVTGSDLPFPEGVAAAEVLKVGDPAAVAEGEDHADSAAARSNRDGFLALVVGGVASAAMALLAALKVAAAELSGVFRLGAGGTMVGTSLSLALIGVGHLVGITVGIAMIVGLLISFGVLLPVFTGGDLPGTGDISEVVSGTFSSDVRFVGAGTMAVAAVWTLAKIIGPVLRGIRESLASSRARSHGAEVDITERDVPVTTVVAVIVALMVPIGLILWVFLDGTGISHHTGSLITLSVLFVLVLGLVIAAVCGYMAGLIGSSNSPISGIGVIIVLLAALLIKVVTGNDNGGDPSSLVAYTLFTAAVVFGVATISNDNLQDLKTGQLVGATPWKQQVGLVIGVVFGSLVIPPIMGLMASAFGFVGAPGAGDDALAAPQAGLLSSVAQGIFGDSLDWGRIGLGALIGVGVIVVDEVLTRTTKNAPRKLALPPLAVGMGMYLPVSLTLIIPLGALLGWLYNRWADRAAAAGRVKDVATAKRTGVLAATGLIVGESLFGVVNAAVIAATGDSDALGIMPDGWAHASQWAGAVIFAAIIVAVYRWAQRRVTKA